MGDKCFRFFESYRNALERAGDEHYLSVVKAMCSYVFDDKVPNLEDNTDMAIWELIKPIIDQGKKISIIRAEAGRSGGGVTRNKGNRNASKQYKTIQNNTDKDKDKEINKEINNKLLTKKGELSLPKKSSFERFKDVLREQCPHVAAMPVQMTEKQFDEALGLFDGDSISMLEALKNIENYKPATKKNRNVYQTLKSWKKRNT